MATAPAPLDEASRQLLRHTVATLAYRAGKVLRDVPAGFAEARASATSRSAVEILAHMVDLMGWGERLARGEYRWEPGGFTDWDATVSRFFDALAALDRALADTGAAAFPAEVMFQGPIADALTHVGQLALLRGLAGQPVRPESYARATIEAGRVGRDQAAPGREFDGDASTPST
ncbi:MAG: hypothetical protein R2708_02180 [Vicinamibacterales bacterium]